MWLMSMATLVSTLYGRVAVMVPVLPAASVVVMLPSTTLSPSAAKSLPFTCTVKLPSAATLVV